MEELLLQALMPNARTSVIAQTSFVSLQIGFNFCEDCMVVGMNANTCFLFTHKKSMANGLFALASPLKIIQILKLSMTERAKK